MEAALCKYDVGGNCGDREYFLYQNAKNQSIRVSYEVKAANISSLLLVMSSISVSVYEM